MEETVPSLAWISACSVFLCPPQGQHSGNTWQNCNHTNITCTPPNLSAIQTLIKCPKTEFNTWLKSFAPGFSARLSYKEEQREHALDFFQHCLSKYACVQTGTGGQQPKAAQTLPQQTLLGKGSCLQLSVGLSLHQGWLCRQC